jgi:deazaflavin-dependent oxidoreductase (nitroreductase family)
MVIVADVGGRIAKRMARINRVVTNPIQRLWAPHLPPFALVVHHGRRTGRTYRTPVTAFTSGGLLVVALPYGADTDWVRNLLAAGGGEVVRRGHMRPLRNPRVVGPDDRAQLPRRLRLVTRVASHALVADLG